MPEYEVEILSRAHGHIHVEADNEDDARAKAEEIGMEISDVDELMDFAVGKATFFQN